MSAGRRHLAALVAVAAASCSSTGGDVEVLLAPQPAKVAVNMVEYRFVYATRVPSGRAVFTVTNAGQSPHRLSLFALPDDAEPIDVQLQAPGGLGLTPLQEMPVLAPGGGGSFAVDLEPGARYAMVSLWPSPEGVPDALLGMSTEFRAAGLPRVGGTQPP